MSSVLKNIISAAVVLGLTVSQASTVFAMSASTEQDTVQEEMADIVTDDGNEPGAAWAAESGSDSNVSTVLISNDGSDSGIRLGLSYGYRNVAKNGHKLPFSVDITNGSDRDISGVLVIAADGSVETGVGSFETAVNSFSFKVDIPAHGEAVVDNVISVAEESSTVELMLYEGDECLARHKEAVSITADGTELLVGLLSDTPDKLDFLNGVSVAKTALRARTIELEPETLPRNALELEQLDVIVISNFDTDKIDEEQLRAIETWAENGGVLLIGGGRNHKAAESFGAYRSNFEISEAVRSEVDMGMQYSKNGPDGAVLPLDVCNISVKDGVQVMQSSDMPTLTVVKLSSGAIGFAAYDLCDISEFCAQEMSFTDDLLTAMIGYSRIDRLINAAGSSREIYDRTNEFMGVTDPSDMPGISLYIIIAVLYIAAVGWLLYYVLRNRGLEIYYHVFVVISAFIGAIVIWMIGAGSRYDGLSLDYTLVREIHGDDISESGYIRIFSAASDSYSVNIPEEYEVYPIVRAATDEATETNSLSDAVIRAGTAYALEDEDTDYKLISFSEDEQFKHIDASGLGPFAGTLLELAADTGERSEGDDIAADLSFFNEALNGSITNNTRYDIEDAAVLLYGRAVRLGCIKSGAVLELDDIKAVSVPIGDTFAAAAYITGLNDLDTGASGYADALKKTRFLSSYIAEHPELYTQGVRLIGFSDGENIFRDISADRSMNVSGTLLKSVSADTDFKSDGYIWRTALNTDPVVVSGDYDIASNTSRGSVVLEYSLGNDINVNALYFTELASVFNSDSTAVFAGRISLYNYITGGYDDISTDMIYSGELISPYLSPANTITVRYIPDNTASTGAMLFLPVPNINGAEK